MRDEQSHQPEENPQPTAYARRGTLTLRGVWTKTELRVSFDKFLSELTCALRGEGCRLIGHIKGILEAGERGQLFFSVTSFHGKPVYKGELSGNFTGIDFALNVIVYGVRSEKIEKLVLEGLRKDLGDVTQGNE